MISFVTLKGFSEVRIINPISSLRKWKLHEEVICVDLANGPGGILIHISLKQTPEKYVDWLPEGKGRD